MTLEVLAVTASGVLAGVATSIVVMAKVRGPASRQIEIISRKSGDKLRVSKSSDGAIRSIEIVNPSADLQKTLDV
jgi:hypothetical protein